MPAAKWNVAKLIVAVVVGAYGLLCAFTPSTFRFLDYLNLAFHEAGHLIFSPFGRFMHFLGGTIGQLFFPVALVFYFAKRNDYFSSSVVMFWVGQNLFNVSTYMKDAMLLNLPLLSDGMTHDWAWIFRRLDILSHCVLVGNAVYFIGFLCILASIAGMVYFSKEA